MWVEGGIHVQLPYTVTNMQGSIHKLWCTTWELYGSPHGSCMVATQNLTATQKLHGAT